MNQKQKQSVVLSILASLALVGLAWFLLISPQREATARDTTAAEEARTETSALQAQIAVLRGQEAKIGEARTEYRDLAARFPESFGEEEWVSQVTEAARSAGVTLKGALVGVPVLGLAASTTEEAPAAGATTPATGGVAASSVNITATGPADGLRRFVAALSELRRPLLIETVDITEAEEAGKSSIEVTGRTFLMRAMPEPVLTPAAP